MYLRRKKGEVDSSKIEIKTVAHMTVYFIKSIYDYLLSILIYTREQKFTHTRRGNYFGNFIILSIKRKLHILVKFVFQVFNLFES